MINLIIFIFLTAFRVVTLPFALTFRIISFVISSIIYIYLRIAVYLIIAGFIGLSIILKMTEHDREPVNSSVRSHNKALILSIRSGGGHKAAGDSIKELFEKNGWAADIYYTDSQQGSPGYDLYASTQSSPLMSITGGLISDFAVKLFIPITSVAYYSEVKELIEAKKYTCVIAVAHHVIPIFDYLDLKVPVIIIPTDLEAHSTWISSKKSYYIACNKSMQKQFKEAEVDMKRVYFAPGMPIKEHFFSDVHSREARRDELNLPHDKDVVLVIFGGCGSYDMEQIMEYIRNSDKHYVFICGNNKRLHEYITEINEKNYNNRFQIEGMVNNMHHWMQAANCVVGKPGPGIITECIASKIPIITAVEGTMKHEKYNLQFVIDNKIGIVINKWDLNLEHVINDAIYNPKYLQSLSVLSSKNQMVEMWGKINDIIRDFSKNRKKAKVNRKKKLLIKAGE